MPEKAFDPISPWFRSAEELGEYIGIRFGRVAPDAVDPEWIFLRHTDTDGIGGFAQILRQRGARIERLPHLKHPSTPSRLSFIKFLPKYLKARRHVKWGPLTGPRAASTNRQPPPAVAWHVFDESATVHVRRVCRRAGVTVNSFLLKHLTKAIRPFLEDESSIVPWMIPVNIRGKVNLKRDTDNHTSYVGIQVRSYETIHEVHRNVYNALGRGEHWANWQAYKLGRLASNGLRKFLLVHERATSQWNLGGFSNLGDWDAEGTIHQSSCLGSWLFCPPVLRFQLIGAGCVTFQNRLSLTIQVHPELTANPEVPSGWIRNWVKEIEMDLASVLLEPATVPAGPGLSTNLTQNLSVAERLNALLNVR